MPWDLVPGHGPRGRWFSRPAGSTFGSRASLGFRSAGIPWSEGDGLGLALERGGGTAGVLDEFYGRAMPAGIPIDEAEFVPLSQLYGQFAEVVSEDGSERFEGDVSWSETNLVQAIARWPGGRAWYRVHENQLAERVRERTVADMIEQARAVGAAVREEPPFTSVLVQATVTQTLGGILVDPRARVVGAEEPLRSGRGRRRDRDGRLLQRARGGARLRPDRRRGSAQLDAGSRYAQGLRSCGSGDWEIRFTTQLPWSSSSTVDPTGGGSPSRSTSS